MRIWIDLANSPHVPFFRPLIADFRRSGHDVKVTARRFAQTIELAERAALAPVVIGAHGGSRLGGKGREVIGRAWQLMRWAGKEKFDLAVSHNSYAQILAARLLGIPAATLMDYEHQPANHLAFRLARRVIVPRAFPRKQLARYGAEDGRVRRYDGIKEDVYLGDFTPEIDFGKELRRYGVESEDVLIVARTPAREALYHRFANTLFDELIEFLLGAEETKIIMLPRTTEERIAYAQRWSAKQGWSATKRSSAKPRLIIPQTALDGANLIAAADLVVSAGGTMNREAAAIGTPAASVYAGEWAAIDELLVREGRLQRIAAPEDFTKLNLAKKAKSIQPRASREGVRGEVARLILGTLE